MFKDSNWNFQALYAYVHIHINNMANKPSETLYVIHYLHLQLQDIQQLSKHVCLFCFYFISYMF